jgi:tRNA-2-methylthio-N6-dimethylallyladenosine synthase
MVRGREHSRDAGLILEEVESLRDGGYGEVTLLGQNVNSYRSGSMDFPGLLRAVADSAGGMWVRFVTSHPKDFGRELAEVMASSDNVCRQLHLPVQSGSDRILSLMNRRYTREGYMELIEMVRETVPGVVLSTDAIAGFPGETEEEFGETVSLLEQVRFDYAFLFRYSPRAGTAACDLPGQLPEEVRLERLGRLQELQRGITVERSRRLEGTELEVLVTGPARKPGQQAARTEGNRLVILDGTGYTPGTRLQVEITSADGWTHFGIPVAGS